MKAFVAAAAAFFVCTAPVMAQEMEQTEPPAAAEAAAPSKPAKPIDYFYGIFQGETRIVGGSGAETEASTRLSRVETTPAEGGFTITWSTLYIDEANPSELKVKDSTDVTFGATPDPKVFRQATPDKLWTGKPYYWARIDGDTLNISALVLDADGTYDVIHYARTVQGDTQRVEFSRFKDGQMQRQVTGTLKRATE